jgi:hypothetical protein
MEMKSNHSWRIRLAQILLGAAIIALVVVRGAKAGDEHVHLVTDWSHRHLVFSEPKSLMKRFELSGNHRYVQQRMRRIAERRWGREEWRWHRAPEDPNHLQGDWSMDMGAGATVGADNYPAKFSFDSTSANCATPAPPVGQQPDFVVYNTSLAGSGTQATVVAFDNLYSSCTGGTPLTYWAFNTGTAGAVVTSPVLSFDGKQVAFIQNTAGAATLVILRWKAGSGTLAAPATPATGSCTALTAPCQTNIAFSTANGGSSTPDSFSSPFYDYSQDVLYVGDDLGFLHKFTGVFLGTPTEVVSTGPSNFWPSSLTIGVAGDSGHLNSPVFVSGFNEILVTANDGLLFSVDATLGGVSSGAGANALDPKLANPGFEEGPLVDVTTGKIYVFARASSEFITPLDPPFHGTPGVPSVFEVDIPATPPDIHLAPYIQSVVSDAGAAIPPAMYLGTFDDLYYSSGTNSGFMYACGTHLNGAVTVNSLWVIAVDNGVMDPTTVGRGPSLTTADVACSPLTEFNNTNTNIDQLFLSVTGSAVTAAPINCPSNTTGCIMSFRLDTILTTASGTLATASVTGGTSGIVIDNSSATPGASQIYFTPLADQPCAGSGGVGTGTGGCAIQASQSLLN